MQCPSCGAVNAIGSRFCGSCGTPAPGAPARVVAVPAPQAAPVATRVVAEERAGAWWAVAIVGLVLGAAIAPFVFDFPWRSLMVPGAAPTLVGDAALGFLVGAAALVGGVLALRSAASEAEDATGTWIAGGIGGFAGALLALALTGEAYRLAHAEILNGHVHDSESIFLAAAFLALVALVGAGIALALPGDRPARLRLIVGALGIAAGAALAGACAWTMMSADALQAAAGARVARNTPNAQLLLMAASLSIAAWAARGRLRRG